MTEVEKILSSKNIRFLPKGKDLLVVCFNVEHDDDNPSMRVDREDGRYHCLSCGYKGNLFSDFNKHRNIQNTKVRNLLEEIGKLRRASGVSLPFDAFSFSELWRGISAKTLEEFEAFTSEADFPGRVVFPIRNAQGTILGCIGRYKESNAKPKYMIKPSGASLPIYPPPKFIKPINNSVVLVEGIYDMLNLREKGLFNVLVSFGTSQINKENINNLLLPYRLQGVEKIFIMFDGDDAGRKAAKQVENVINYNTDLLVDIIILGEDSDPGNLTQEDVDQIKNYITGE